MFHILVVEDEKNIQNMISDYLEGNGFSVFKAENGLQALDIIGETHIDLLITDVMMPIINGYSLTSQLRASGYEIPILMITAKESINDKEKGFNSGTDDYMVKPISLKEMLLRVNALLKRAKIGSDKVIVIGNTTLDFESFIIREGDTQMNIPKKEFMLLFKLLSNPNKIFTRLQLMDEIWGYDSESDDSTIKVHISKLRERFKDNKDFQIVTVKGLGYKGVIV